MKSSYSMPLPVLLLALAGTLTTPHAWGAAEPTPSEISVARRLFDEGKAAEDAGRYRAAAEKFRQAASIKDTPGIRFHLARCEEQQGALVEALVEYDRARELIEGGVKAADVEKLLPAARERVRAKVALLTLKLPEGVRDVSVELDGRPLAGSVLSQPMPLNPGKHRLSASSVGRTGFASEVELTAGEARQLVIELPEAPRPPAPTERAVAPVLSGRASTPRSDAQPSARTLVLVGEAAFFAAGVSTGIIFSVARSSANDRYETANDTVLAAVHGSDPQGTACARADRPPACTELEDSGRDRSRAANLAAAGFITAGASAAAFGLTYWWWPEAAPALPRATALPGGLALSMTGRF
jgi:hypothetical protein